MKSTFEEMGGTYRRVGDYYLPNILLNLLDELEQECLQEYRTLRQPNRHSIPVDLGDAI